MVARNIVTAGALLGALGFVGVGSAASQGMAKPAGPAGRKVTVSGTVIDVSCRFGQGLSVASHRMCAQVCAGKGIPLAILTSDGHLYIPASPAMPGDGQNERLKDFAEQEVTVTGTAFAAGGANAIWIETIKAKS